MTETKKTRVIVGMSGGVDSSAAAALLLEQGYDVVGITLKLWPQDCVSRAEDKCCGPQAVTDARGVCHQLGIPYYLVDEAETFQKQVIAYFAEEYKAGAPEITHHLDVLDVPYYVAVTTGPSKRTSRELGWNVKVRWEDLGQLQRWVPALRRMVDALEGGPSESAEARFGWQRPSTP